MPPTSRSFRPRIAHGLLAAALALAPGAARGQPTAPLTVAAAQAAARETSPDLRAARAAVATAAGRERQAGAFPNPTFAYGREQTSRAGQTNAQDVAQLDAARPAAGARAARRPRRVRAT